MNSVPFNFSGLPVDKQFYVLSKATDPRCGRFAVALPQSLSEISKISLVCNDWYAMVQEEVLWRPILEELQSKCSYIDFSSADSCALKVQILIMSLKDLKFVVASCNMEGLDREEPQDVTLQRIQHLRSIQCSSFFSIPEFLENHTQTNLFLRLLKREKFEQIAKFLLFKPRLEASKIASRLIKTRIDTNSKSMFCLELLIKQNYDMSMFFKNALNSPHITAICLFNSIVNMTGLKINDYTKSGCNFALAEQNIPHFSLLNYAFKFIRRFYDTGKFQNPVLFTADAKRKELAFEDEKLNKLIQCSASESDLLNFMVNILNVANTNYSDEKGPILEQFRQFAEKLPLGNAISAALIQFDTAP